MQRMICALLLSFVAMLVIGPKVIPLLHKLNFGQTIYDLGPKTHKSKQGTPDHGRPDDGGCHAGHVSAAASQGMVWRAGFYADAAGGVAPVYADRLCGRLHQGGEEAS